jgi:hypothetical protein
LWLSRKEKFEDHHFVWACGMELHIPVTVQLVYVICIMLGTAIRMWICGVSCGVIRCVLVHIGLMFLVLVKGDSNDYTCVCLINIAHMVVSMLNNVTVREVLEDLHVRASVYGFMKGWSHHRWKDKCLRRSVCKSASSLDPWQTWLKWGEKIPN